MQPVIECAAEDTSALLEEDPAYVTSEQYVPMRCLGNQTWRVKVAVLIGVLFGTLVILAPFTLAFRHSYRDLTAGSPLQAVEFQEFQPQGCGCGWIANDDCQNADACACFCRRTHPEGPCTTCSPTSHKKVVSPAPTGDVWPATTGPFIGVNLGGWLVLEDWMWASEMMDKHIPDEWTLVMTHGGPESPEAINLLKSHWESFVTEADLDRLRGFGISHVRIPIGYWLVDYDPADGFVDGGKYYLTRVLGWLRSRGMKALLDLHALPCAQAIDQSFTGKKSRMPWFFGDMECYERGKHAMRKLAELIVSYEKDEPTAGVVMGMNMINEPDWSYWETSPGIKELYRTMIPELRKLLPADKYAFHVFFWDLPRASGAKWLASMQQLDPKSFTNVVYDLHLYHSFGDDNAPGRQWNPDVDSCKTCCRDPKIIAPVVAANVSIAVGEYSLNTGFAGGPDFWKEYLRLQLSLWQHTEGVVGSFFWNHRILLGSNGYFREFSLLDLIAPMGPLPPVSQLDVGGLCPGYDLSKCPHYNQQFVHGKDACIWRP